MLKTDFYADYRAQTSSIYIPNESSWGIEDRYSGKESVGTKLIGRVVNVVDTNIVKSRDPGT